MITPLAIAFMALSVTFLAFGLAALVRAKEAKGSLRWAKASIVAVGFTASAAFMTDTASQIVFQAQPDNNATWELVKQLYVPLDLFAMLVLAFISSYAIFATYSGRRRRLIVLLVFVIALIPTAYLAFAWNQATLRSSQAGDPGSYLLTVPQYTDLLFALCGTPLALIPLIALGRSFIAARRIGDRILSHRAAMMLSSLLLNEVAYAFFAFYSGIVELVTIVLWIPFAFFMLFAVLKITSPLEPKG